MEGNNLSDIQTFSNGKFSVEFDRCGDTFTVKAPAMARQLGYHSAKDMLRAVPDDEKGWAQTPTPGGEQQSWYLTEPGFYRVLGRRDAKHINNPERAEFVAGFQRWIYGDVLPEIRRTGGYSGRRSSHAGQQPRNAMEQSLEPALYTWDEVAALIRQRTGIALTVNELTRNLRAGGVLKQTGAPTAKYKHLFWFTGSSWNVHSHVMPQLTYKVFETGRELQDFRFIQARLEIEGVGQAVPAQRQPGLSRTAH